jgi:glutamate--cysteine ligase
MQTKHQTPHLTTATTEPLNILERQLLSQEKKIENWFEAQWKISRAPVYGSVDLRNAGFKLAPVDMNLFPAGFNNLNVEFLPISIEASYHAINQFYPGAKKLLLIPESHTRNRFYWENIKRLLEILSKAGFIVRIGSLLPDAADVISNSGEKIRVESLMRKDNRIGLNDFDPEIILLNNDLSDGIPEILQHLEQQIIPPAELGWSQRLKSGHFQHYKDVALEFAKLIDIDPWFIDPLFKHCGELDFMQREGEQCLSKNVEQLLEAIQKKYDEYKIDSKPFVIVKADAGTYGMAVMTVRDAKEVQSLNRKQRTHMAKSKGGQPVQRVIVQEGVYTFETWGDGNSVAEPVVYMWGERVVGGFYRVHKERGIDENLNAPGMHFEPLAFVKTCHKPLTDASPGECQNRFYAYGVIARLSMLAAAREILEQVEKDTVSG